MSITHTQRADIGTRFLEEIDRRISLRTAAKGAVPEVPKTNSAAVLEAAAKDLQDLGINLGALVVHNIDVNSYGEASYDFELRGGSELSRIPQSKCPALRALLKDDNKNQERKRKLCTELEFLHGLKGGSIVDAFQSYVARLWVPATKDEALGKGALGTFFDAFADSKRGFTCSL